MTVTNNYNRKHNDYNKEHNAYKKYYNKMQTWEAWKEKKFAFTKGQQWREEDMHKTPWSSNTKSLMFKKFKVALVMITNWQKCLKLWNWGVATKKTICNRKHNQMNAT